MWHGDTIYFNSDRDENRRFNLYAYSLITDKRQRSLPLRTTMSSGLRSAEIRSSLKMEDICTSTYSSEREPQADDHVSTATRSSRSPGGSTSRSLSLDFRSLGGKRAIIEARGDIFTVPAKDGPTRN